MIQRIALLLFLTPLIAGVVGCQGNRELQQELLNLKNETSLQLELLNRHNDFLTRKTDLVEERVERLSSSDRQLTREVNIYGARPDQIKREILDEVDVRGQMAADQRTAFTQEFDDRLTDKSAYLSDKTRTTIAGFERALDHEDRFFRFVFAEQDSMNLEFVSRFQDRPWYESLLGRWEQQENSAPVP